MSRTSSPESMLFSRDRACEIVDVEPHMLALWDEPELCRPSVGSFYRFQDLVGLRVLRALSAAGVPTREMKRMGRWLAERFEHPWSTRSFSTDGRRIYYVEQGALVGSVGPGQVVEPRVFFDIKKITTQVRRSAATSTRRPQSLFGQVERRRGVASGQSVIAGTRIPTAQIAELYRDLENPTIDEVRRQYPTLSAEDIVAALKHERVPRVA